MKTDCSIRKDVMCVGSRRRERMKNMLARRTLTNALREAQDQSSGLQCIRPGVETLSSRQRPVTPPNRPSRRMLELRTTGFTPIRYLLELHLNTAMKLLRQTDHSNEQIARECGFGDRYSFTRIFTKHRQTTPAAFRKEARA